MLRRSLTRGHSVWHLPFTIRNEKLDHTQPCPSGHAYAVTWCLTVVGLHVECLSASILCAEQKAVMVGQQDARMYCQCCSPYSAKRLINLPLSTALQGLPGPVTQ